MHLHVYLHVDVITCGSSLMGCASFQFSHMFHDMQISCFLSLYPIHFVHRSFEVALHTLDSHLIVTLLSLSRVSPRKSRAFINEIGNMRAARASEFGMNFEDHSK